MIARRRAFAVLRWAFFVASVLYLARFARSALAHGQAAAWPGTQAFAPAVLAYAATAAFAVLGWHALLSRLSRDIRLPPLARILCTTQVAKYLPGNIGHHLGRITLTRAAFSIPAATVAASVVQEAAVASLASLLLGTACYATGAALPVRIAGFDLRWMLAAALVTGVFALALVNAGRGFLSARRPAAALAALAPTWPALAAALPCYLATSALNGLAIASIAAAFVPLDAATFLLLTGAYALSWTVGFLLPGPPGGLGVREAALVALLGNVYPAGVILALTLWARLATVAADLLIFCAGLVLAHVGRPGTTGGKG